ncbi:integrator complex subunit 9 [Phtheirospermum japonicum]|uniref:Integrator complex subunit 9 n=1 Tax=Phtheirospermum japonicum TaxID=374723 RepID=A0A830D443_9LAMI|nr:integrator complex subunit 9 [Phtheirospermum japonicum]
MDSLETFTCLSEGKGFYFPPCHILDICGFRVLFDCPMDLSSLSVFSPVPMHANETAEYVGGPESNEGKRSKIEKTLNADSLICAEPRYKTVKNLLLWDVSSIDIVLISSPMGMLALPYLTRNIDFSAKVYATEAVARIGQLMMEDLANMHMEFRQFYGPAESDAPQWMKWDELELMPLELRQLICGVDGTEFGGWMLLYSAADVKACMLKVHTLKFAEEVCYNGTLIVKPFSSGLEIGSCNWNITGPKESFAYVSSSVFSPTTAMGFDYKALQTSDVILYSDFSSRNAVDKFDDDNVTSATLFNDDEYLEEMEKLDFICSCSTDSIKAGGSVLIPIGRLGIILQLLERFALDMASENMKVPIFVISSVAEELMAFTNIIPEWLCKQLQDREGVDASLALLPFKPMAMKVLQCSFLSGMSVQKSHNLLQMLQPRHVLFPEIYRQHITPLETSFSFGYYHENEMLHIPYTNEYTKLEIAIELLCRLPYTTLQKQEIDVARLKGELVVEQGRYKLLVGNERATTQAKPLLHFGRVDLNVLLMTLQKMSMSTTVEEVKGTDGTHTATLVLVTEPRKAVIEVTEAQTLITTGDDNIASLISQAVCSILDFASDQNGP